MWVFRALWSAAPKLAEVHDPQQQQQSTAAAGRARCHLHLLVPDTVLFQRGEPCKWVGTSPQGTVVRKSFLHVSSDGSASSNTAGAGEGSSEFRRHPDLGSRLAAQRRKSSASRAMNDFEVFERLDAVIAAFLNFAASGLPPSSSSDMEDDVPVCVARYTDGTSELLSGKSLKTLCRFFNWRASLCALQAYVRPLQGSTSTATTTVGIYSRRQREKRNKNPQNGRRQRSTANQGRSCAASGRAAASRTGIEHGKDGKKRKEENSSLTAPSSTTAATFDLQPAESPLSAAPDGDSSSATSLQSLKTALNQATEDVAFVTDLSYAWPAEPLRTLPRRAHGNATSPRNNGSPTDIASHEHQDIATNKTSPPMAVGGGGSVGQIQRHRPPWPRSRLQVSHMEAEFSIDQAGRPWFTNAPKVWFVSCKSSICGPKAQSPPHHNALEFVLKLELSVLS